MTLPLYLALLPAPQPEPSQQVRADQWRIQVLTDRLMRIEWSPSGQFEDRPTQMVMNRLLPGTPSFTVTHHKDDSGVTVTTPHMTLHYDGEEFSSHGLYATTLMPEEWGAEWRWNVRSERPWKKGQNLRGTRRTLDDVNGRAPLEDGILDGRGITALADTTAPLAPYEDRAASSPREGKQGDGQAWWPLPREDGSHDVYIFAYGWDFPAAIADYYRLTGVQPIIPRWALGNWWSRYHRYSDEEYLQLMDRFNAEGIPLSVAVIDMDWHLVDVPEKYGSGWTGFTWNRDLFPDPAVFLADLKGRGLATVLNLHPADGIRPFEDTYADLAGELGIDPSSDETIPFTPDDPHFMAAYMRHVLEPLEELGVDAWWVDWQQGSWSQTRGLDPLWLLNHTHVRHNQHRHGGRGLTLSRYAGPGSHRYPVGFSGDTTVSWESLAFQPEFTATASNIGYGWWSHDIGGHMFGVNDRELQTRWVQFGVFSPIMRLHSSNNPLMSKEPWNWGMREQEIQAEYMRLRHRLLPYIHSEQCWGHTHLSPLITPMYWHLPDDDDAWKVPNQYYFGRQLVIAPMTEAEDPASGCARVDVFVPEGVWADLMTGRFYRGGRRIAMYRPMEFLPVLAAEGTVLPLSGQLQHDEASVVSLSGSGGASPMVGVEHPEQMEVVIVAGADGAYELIEDDGHEGGVSAKTLLIWNDIERTLTVKAVQISSNKSTLCHPEERWDKQGSEGIVPRMRQWKIRLFDPHGTLRVVYTDLIPTHEDYQIGIPITREVRESQSVAWVWEIARRAQIDNTVRAAIVEMPMDDIPASMSHIWRLPLPDGVRGALIEALCAL